MTRSRLDKNSGTAAVSGGILGIILVILTLTGSVPEWFYILFDIVILVSLVGVFLSVRSDTGTWGEVGLTVAIGGMIITFLDALMPDILWKVGSMILGVGLILISVGLIKSGRLTVWAPVFWILAVVIGVPGLFSESLNSTFIASLATFLFASGFLGAGWGLLSSGTTEPENSGKSGGTVDSGTKEI